MVKSRRTTAPASEPHRQGDAMRALVADLKAKIAIIAEGGPEAAREAHVGKGKLLPRARVERLLDPGTPFLELSQLAAHEVYDTPLPAAGLITGIGRIAGRLCMIVCNDATVEGGAYYPLTVKKHLRAQEIARENRLPCVYLLDSRGLHLPLQDEAFPDRDHFGRILYNQATMSAAGIPQISVVMGPCMAGGAYGPALSDETIIVQNQGAVFLTPPPLVKASTGEAVSAEELGGSEISVRAAGVADHLARDDAHALDLARRIIGTLPAPRTPDVALQPPVAPKFAPESIYEVIPEDTAAPYDVHEVIVRLVDDSAFDPFRPLVGDTLVTGFARIWGMPVGILADNGARSPESARKGAHFIELCCQRRIPLLFLQNSAGFAAGPRHEHAGLVREGAKLVAAVACAQVPKITVIIGGSYGAGNYGMCGRASSPRFLYMWPNARISVLSAGEAAASLAAIRREAIEAKGNRWPASEEEAFKTPLRNQYDLVGHPYYASARLWDDGVIDPAETRNVVGLSLAAALNAPIPATQYGVFRM